jgi:hypothetical protein
MFTRISINKTLALLAITVLPLTASAQVFSLPTANTNTGGKIWRGEAQPLYKTKAELIAAAHNGDLLGLANVNTNTPMGEDADMQKRLTASIAVILADDYQTGVPSDTFCAMRLAAGGVRMLSQATAIYTMTLTNTPPDFTFGNTDQVTRARAEANSQMNSVFNSCTRKVLGADQPFPMVESLKDLLRTYAATTKEVVEAKRAERVQAYQVAQQHQQEAQQRAAADKAKAEQQRIDAERKRIEKEQQDQKARDDARVSG